MSKIVWKPKHGHYYKDVSNLAEIDIYRVLSLYAVTDPCISHAVKKLLCAGQRGGKNEAKDISEAIIALIRWQTIKKEDINE